MSDASRTERNLFQLQPAGLDLGEVEQIIHQPQERHGRAAGDSHLMLLLVVQADPASTSSIPITPFSGVRISWLTRARNDDLA